MGHWHYTTTGPPPDDTASTRVKLTYVPSVQIARPWYNVQCVQCLLYKFVECIILGLYYVLYKVCIMYYTGCVVWILYTNIAFTKIIFISNKIYSEQISFFSHRNPWLVQYKEGLYVFSSFNFSCFCVSFTRCLMCNVDSANLKSIELTNRIKFSNFILSNQNKSKLSL